MNSSCFPQEVISSLFQGPNRIFFIPLLQHSSQSTVIICLHLSPYENKFFEGMGHVLFVFVFPALSTLPGPS